jgi:hypothetical protein
MGIRRTDRARSCQHLSYSSSSLSLYAQVGSTAPHPAGEPGWSDGLAIVLGEVWATALSKSDFERSCTGGWRGSAGLPAL